MVEETKENFISDTFKSEVTQSCPTLCDPVDCSLPSSSVHGILQARILEWVAVSFSRGSSRPKDRTRVSCIGGRHFNLWATREAPWKWYKIQISVFVNFHWNTSTHLFACCLWLLASNVCWVCITGILQPTKPCLPSDSLQKKKNLLTSTLGSFFLSFFF